MRDLAKFYVSLIVTITRLVRRAGTRIVVAELQRIGHQDLSLNCSREQMPDIRPRKQLFVRLFVSWTWSARLFRSGIVLNPFTILSLNLAIVKHKCRPLFTPKNRGMPVRFRYSKNIQSASMIPDDDRDGERK